MKEFGSLKVIKDEPNKKLLCLCDCGNTIEIYRCDFERKANAHCGCKKDKHENQLTKEFLIEHYINLNKSPRQICKEFKIKSYTSIYYWLEKHDIRRRNRKEAEILNVDRCIKARKFYEEISGSYWGSIQRGAKSRNIEFNISREYIWDLFIKQNRKCALTGYDITFKRRSCLERHKQTASLDRIHSNKGYITDNVQWIHKDIQTLKMSLDNKELFNFCKDIYNNMKDKME